MSHPNNSCPLPLTHHPHCHHHYTHVFCPGTSAAQLDALQQQLDEVNGRLVRSAAADLVKLMLPDVLQPPDRGGMAQVRGGGGEDRGEAVGGGRGAGRGAQSGGG